MHKEALNDQNRAWYRLRSFFSRDTKCKRRYKYYCKAIIIFTSTSIFTMKSYRAIAFSSIFGKVFDWGILERSKKINNFNTPDLQHGF